MKRSLHIALALLVLLAMPARADIYEEEGAPAREGDADAAIPYYEPESEALRSIVVPGWSQFRQGADNAGYAYLFIAMLSAAFAFGVVDVPWIGDEDDNFGQVFAAALYGGNAVASGFDAHRRATESNRENGWDLEGAALRPDPQWRLAFVRVRF